ncbi:hypothetical protein EZS27_029174 [termite gut metagenome]|uniref:Prevent-host-death protein n=1 Tax=termite gut metagenome TaxID=433724 RepID=A0A5J4QGW9_9ZZZZ
MIVITPIELKTNQNKYFDLAEKERVAIRWGGKIIELVVSDEISANPSPSGDPWFDDLENMASLNRGIEDIKHGRVREFSSEELKALLGI